MAGVEGFAAVPNWMVRDEAISLYAIAVYTALASHSGPGGIHPSQPTLAREARCSESSVRRALVELEELGVVSRVRRKNRSGRASNGYVLSPNGHLRADEEVAVTLTDTYEVPVRGEGGSGQGEQVAPYIEEEPTKKNPSIVSPASVEAEFAQFWAVYPRKVGKSAALAKFVQVVRKGVAASVLVDAAARFAGDPNLPEPQFIPHPVTWLNQGRWEDEPLPARAGGFSRPSTVDHGLEVHELLVAREQGDRLAVTA